MTTYGAYEAGLPCKNQSCKSHGTPHPNCRCYGEDMADGGEAKSFCSSTREHQPDCEYFDNGGMAGAPEIIKAADFTPDEHPPDYDQNSNLEPSELQAKMRASANPSNAVDDSPDIIPKDEFTPDVIPKDDFVPDQTPAQLQSKIASKYGAKDATMGTLGALGEGIAKGVAGPVVPAIEIGLSKLGVPNVSAEDQNKREEDFSKVEALGEGAALYFTMGRGKGGIGLLNKGTTALVDAVPVLGKYGATALKGFMPMFLWQGGDEITKAMLGQGDPEAPVSSHLVNMVIAGGLGAASELGANALSKKLKDVAAQKMGTDLNQRLAGFGLAAKQPDAATRIIPEGASAALKEGATAYDALVNPYTKWSTGLGLLHGANEGRKEGYKEEGVPGAITGALSGGFEGALKGFGYGLVGKGIVKINKYVAPTFLKVMSAGPVSKPIKLLDYVNSVAGGANELTGSVNDLLKPWIPKTVDYVTSKDREELRNQISNGNLIDSIKASLPSQGPAPQNFAQGGMVNKLPKTKSVAPLVQDDDPVATHFPEQNMMIQAAKGRIYNYLAATQPQKNQPKLAFDDPPDDREAKRTYDRALDVALKPLSVLSHIRAGTIDPEHIKHLTSMYPEVTSHLQKKITEQISQSQLDGKKYNYKVRQGLSMLMGTPLSGEFTPENIIAAQSVFAPKQAQAPAQQPSSKNKKGTSALAKAGDSYMTGDQARQARQSKP